MTPERKALENAVASLEGDPAILPEAVEIDWAAKYFTPLPSPEIDVGGTAYMRDGKGNLVPKSAVKPMDLLMDETVRKIMGFGIPLSSQVARFKAHSFDDIAALASLMAQEYNTRLGGKKGNMTLTSFDGCYAVEVQVADNITFGPELQIAKTLVDECLNEWASDARDEIKAIVTRAFNTDKEGQINRSEIFMLLRLEIADERWQNAMRAIRDAIRVIGSKTYVRLSQRPSPDAEWEPVTINLAKA
jgi:hypothetical protein